MQQSYKILNLPPNSELESIPVLRALKDAHRHLAELKGRASSIPNQGILIETLILQEAKASSEIENIVTTQDELFQSNPSKNTYPTPDAKEVALYGKALHQGFQDLKDKDGIITNNSVIGMYQTLKRNTGGYRQTPGTTLKNDSTGAIVYVPPQSGGEIARHMGALEEFINGGEHSDIDPLVRMALVHHQFESIHPFPDGNGRIGRILNVLFLVQNSLLDIPILYISRYITRHKDEYYRLLQSTRDTGEWEPWILYMISAVSETAEQTVQLVADIRDLMAEYKNRLRENHGKIYSHELVNNLFRHPYTRIEYVMEEVGVTRQTAGRYLDQLSDPKSGLLIKHKSGLNNYYINMPLVELLTQKNEPDP